MTVNDQADEVIEKLFESLLYILHLIGNIDER